MDQTSVIRAPSCSQEVNSRSSSLRLERDIPRSNVMIPLVFEIGLVEGSAVNADNECREGGPEWHRSRFASSCGPVCGNCAAVGLRLAAKIDVAIRGDDLGGRVRGDSTYPSSDCRKLQKRLRGVVSAMESNLGCLLSCWVKRRLAEESLVRFCSVVYPGHSVPVAGCAFFARPFHAKVSVILHNARRDGGGLRLGR